MKNPIKYEDLNPSRIEEWSVALGTILQGVIECLRSGEGSCRSEYLSDLKEFVEWSPFGSLDKVALDTVNDVVAKSIDEALDAIAGRTADLQRLDKDLRAVAAGTQQDATAIRLEAVTKVIEASTKSIEALSSLEKSVKDDASAGELAKKVRELIKKIQALRNELEAT